MFADYFLSWQRKAACFNCDWSDRIITELKRMLSYGLPFLQVCIIHLMRWSCEHFNMPFVCNSIDKCSVRVRCVLQKDIRVILLVNTIQVLGKYWRKMTISVFLCVCMCVCVCVCMYVCVYVCLSVLLSDYFLNLLIPLSVCFTMPCLVVKQLYLQIELLVKTKCNVNVYVQTQQISVIQRVLKPLGQFVFTCVITL